MQTVNYQVDYIQHTEFQYLLKSKMKLRMNMLAFTLSLSFRILVRIKKPLTYLCIIMAADFAMNFPSDL